MGRPYFLCDLFNIQSRYTRSSLRNNTLCFLKTPPQKCSADPFTFKYDMNSRGSPALLVLPILSITITIKRWPKRTPKVENLESENWWNFWFLSTFWQTLCKYQDIGTLIYFILCYIYMPHFLPFKDIFVFITPPESTADPNNPSCIYNCMMGIVFQQKQEAYEFKSL